MPSPRFSIIHWLLILAIMTLIACGGNSNKTPPNLPAANSDTSLISGDFRGTIISSNATHSKLSPPELLQDNAKNTLMIWQENDGFDSRYFYRYRNAVNKSWGASNTIPYLPPNTIINYQSNGNNFMLVGTDKTQLFHMTFNGTDWSQKTSITLPELVTSIDKITMGSNGSGYAIAVDGRNSNFISVMHTLVFENGQWGSGYIANRAYDIVPKKIVSNGSSYAIIWSALNASVANAIDFYVSTFTNSEWTPKLLVSNISTMEFTSTQSVQITSSTRGYAAAWLQKNGTINRVYTAIYDTAMTTPVWSDPVPMDSGISNSHALGLASNGTGYAIAWGQEISTMENNVLARVFTTTWSTETPLNSFAQTAQTIRSLKIASNRIGYAVTWYNRRTISPQATAYSYFAAIHNGVNWLPESQLGIGGNADNLQNRPLQLSTNGQNYAVAWIDAPANTAYNTVYATVSANNTWPASPALIEATSIEYNQFVFGSLYLSLILVDSNYALLWERYNNQDRAYLEKLYTQNSTWGETSIILSPVTQGSSSMPMLTRNNSGTLAAVWSQYNSGNSTYYMNSKAGISWNEATELKDCSYDFDPQIKILSNGVNFLIVCQGLDFSGFSGQTYYYAIPFDGAQLGQAAKLIPRYAEITLAANGPEYIVAWSETNGDNYSINVQKYNNTQWSGTAELVASGTKLTSVSPKIAVNGATYAMAWMESYTDTNQTLSRILSRIYNPGNNTWEPKLVVENLPVGINDFSITATDNGTFHIGWVYGDVFSASFVNGAWTSPVAAESAVDSFAVQPLSMVNQGNNLALAWLKDGQILSNFYSNGVWEQEKLVFTDPAIIINNPGIVSNNSSYTLSWKEDINSRPQLYLSLYQNGNWSKKLTIATNTRNIVEHQVVGYNNAFSLIWTQNNPNDTTDGFAHRVWVSDEF